MEVIFRGLPLFLLPSPKQDKHYVKKYIPIFKSLLWTTVFFIKSFGQFSPKYVIYIGPLPNPQLQLRYVNYNISISNY